MPEHPKRNARRAKTMASRERVNRALHRAVLENDIAAVRRALKMGANWAWVDYKTGVSIRELSFLKSTPGIIDLLEEQRKARENDPRFK